MREGTHGAPVELRNATKAYGDHLAVDRVSVTVGAGELITLLGPSGSGKTTTLNMIAGFVGLTSGQLFVDGRELSHLAPHKRGIGMVFQQYSLFPHMTVFENIAFPLQQRKMQKQAIHREVADVVALVGLEGFEHRYPRQLSGGQQQRVAVARAIVFHPRLLLMDEPLGALDKNLRESLQHEIRRLHSELGITIIYVTHDQEEAVTLSDRIAVFNQGRIEQVGTPKEVYESPQTLFAAKFLGESNVFTGRLMREGDDFVLIDEETSLRAKSIPGLEEGDRGMLVVRPERIEVRSPGGMHSPQENVLSGVVRQIVYLGASRRIEVELRGGKACVARESSRSEMIIAEGREVVVAWPVGDAVLLSENGSRPNTDPEPPRARDER